MKFISNLPDAKHVPYPILEKEPHLKTIVSFFRPSDYATIGAFGLGFPGALMMWGITL
jgi:hypothetical protein